MSNNKIILKFPKEKVNPSLINGNCIEQVYKSNNLTLSAKPVKFVKNKLSANFGTKLFENQNLENKFLVTQTNRSVSPSNRTNFKFNAFLISQDKNVYIAQKEKIELLKKKQADLSNTIRQNSNWKKEKRLSLNEEENKQIFEKIIRSTNKKLTISHKNMEGYTVENDRNQTPLKTESINKNKIFIDVIDKNLNKYPELKTTIRKSRKTQSLKISDTKINFEKNQNTDIVQSIRTATQNIGLDENSDDSKQKNPKFEIVKSKQRILSNQTQLSNSEIDILRKTQSKLKETKSNEEKESNTKYKRVTSISEISNTGFVGNQQKRINQDAYFIVKNFTGQENSLFIGVCDGHGLNGHQVSSFIKDNLPIHLESDIKNKIYSDKASQIITDNFRKINHKIIAQSNFDTNFSGSTCVCLIFSLDKIICANVGDSRAVLGQQISEQNWKSYDLSRDHKPDEIDEKERILNKDGRIESMKDENGEFVGPLRVWFKTQNYPGLAMTRSFGDRAASQVGVIAEPEIREWKINENDKFLIIASDGLWEFISSQESVNIVKDYYLKNDPCGACQYLVKEASKRWINEEEVIDDITVIIIFLE